MKKSPIVSKRMTNISFSLLLMSGLAIFLQACKQDQSTQNRSGIAIPLNIVSLDGITNSSIGSAILSSGGGLNVDSMNTLSDGVSTDFTHKTSWVDYDEVHWPESGSATLLLNAVDGSTTTSSLNLISSDSSMLSFEPIFTGQAKYLYTLTLYKGSVLVDSEYGLGSINGPGYINIPTSRAKKSKSANPLTFTMSGDWRKEFNVNPVGACEWSIEQPSGNSVFVTTPLGKLDTATRIVMTEVISGGSYPYYTFDHIQQLGTIGSMKIDSIAVN